MTAYEMRISDWSADLCASDLVAYIEEGWPGANPTDTEFFAEKPALKRAKFVAFGMTKRPGRSAANDPGLAQILGASADAACLVGKSWDFQVAVALGITKNGRASCRERVGQ